MKHTRKDLTKQLEYMYGLERFGIKLGLEVMEALLAELGHPHQKFASIHITGTNGKGSTAAMLESILRTAGLKTALYTSPHLFAFNERIKINNAAITDQELGRLIETVKTAAERTNLQPTFFEFTTAIAFLYFAQHQPDMAIIEVGMGGTLDATNVLTPKVSVITNVDLDHVPFIGRTKAEIAANKAGIIKTGVPVVTGESAQDIRNYFEAVCAEKKTYLRVASREIKTEVLQQDYRQQHFVVNAKRTFALPLLGRHQLENVAVVLLVLEELEKQGIQVSDETIRQGLAATQWLGRLSIISEKPFILVDGAHNPQSLEALYSFLTDEATRPQSLDVLVTGVKNDKDIAILRDKIAPLFERIIATQGSYEPMPAKELARVLLREHIEVLPDPQQATRRGLELISDQGAMVITGSLYMIPEALTYLREKLPSATSKTLSSTL